ncbi:MAG: hypothetical protein HDR22_10565 [Lachnospiraceae bacterium]|nr:hypothetical protein [Lachnospiraceae bacterium]
MKKFKKLWKKDKRVYLCAIFVLSLYALIYFGNRAHQEYDYLKRMAEIQKNDYQMIEKNLDYYIEKGVIKSEQDFYRKYTVVIDNERLVRVDSWGIYVFDRMFHVLYRNLIIALFLIQTIRFYLYDSRRGREFITTLPVKKRTLILYEWASGGVLVSIPVLCTLLPVIIYEIALGQYAKENHCWFMDYSELSYDCLMVLSGWVAILFLYSAFILIRYLTNSLAANYLVGIVICGTSVALAFIFDSFSLFYGKILMLDMLFGGIGNVIYDFPWYFMPSSMVQVIIQALFAVLFIMAAIIFTEKCKRECNGMFAHKAVKVLFLISIYIWCFLFFLNSAEKVPLAVMTLISLLGSGLITLGAGYLVRDR